jgi:hypothetical protein
MQRRTLYKNEKNIKNKGNEEHHIEVQERTLHRDARENITYKCKGEVTQ